MFRMRMYGSSSFADSLSLCLLRLSQSSLDHIWNRFPRNQERTGEVVFGTLLLNHEQARRFGDGTWICGPKEPKRGRGAAGKTGVACAVENNGSKLGRVRLAVMTNCAKKKPTDFQQADLNWKRRFIRTAGAVTPMSNDLARFTSAT